MPTAADSNGIPRYIESDAGTNGTFSSLLNRGLDWVSAALGTTAAPTAVALQNSFAVGNGNVLELKNGLCELFLHVSKSGSWGANTVVGIIPTGYRPKRRQIVTGHWGGTVKEMVVDTNGEVRFANPSDGGVGFTALYRVPWS